MHDTGTVADARQTVARLTEQIESVQCELRRLNQALAAASAAPIRYVTVQAICPACGTWERGMGASSAGVFLRAPRCFHCGRRCRGVVVIPPPAGDEPDQVEAHRFASSLMHDAYWFACALPSVVAEVVPSFDAAVAAVRNWLSPESPMETALRDALAVHGVRPVLQYRVGAYRLDFAFPEKKVGIEVDGHAYHSTKIQRTKDAQRDRFLTSLGWAVLRYTGTEVYQRPTECAKEIVSILQTR